MRAQSPPRLKESLEAYLYLAPAAIILAIFWFLPVVVSLAMSVGNVTALKPFADMEFVGLKQYTTAFKDPTFQKTLWNTVNYVLYSVPTTLILSLSVALLMNSQIRARGFFRTVFFLPYVTTWVAIAIVFKYLFHREFGLGNWFLGILSTDILGLAEPWRLEWLREPRGIWEMLIWNNLGIQLQPMPGGINYLLKGPSLALFSIIITTVWRDIGYFMVIFLAGLQNIDKSLYEAAEIDGAGPVARFKAITFPLLSPVSFFLLIISMIGSFKVFVPQFMMTPEGGPDNSTMPLVMYLYQEGFMGEWKLSYAAAIAYILTMIILALTFIQNQVFGKKVEYGQ
jgi:multiple sugar transport system permease protein